MDISKLSPEELGLAEDGVVDPVPAATQEGGER